MGRRLLAMSGENSALREQLQAQSRSLPGAGVAGVTVVGVDGYDYSLHSPSPLWPDELQSHLQPQTQSQSQTQPQQDELLQLQPQLQPQPLSLMQSQKTVPATSASPLAVVTSFPATATAYSGPLSTSQTPVNSPPRPASLSTSQTPANSPPRPASLSTSQTTAISPPPLPPLLP